MSKIEHKKSSLFLCRKHTVVWKDAPHFHGGRERWEKTPSHQMLQISIYCRKTILTRSVRSAILLSKWREKEKRFISFSLSIYWIAWYFSVSTCLWRCIGELILPFSHSLHHLEGNSTTRRRATHKGLLFFLFLSFVCDLQSTCTSTCDNTEQEQTANGHKHLFSFGFFNLETYSFILANK